MVRFQDGPAHGVVMDIRRCPSYLRVVSNAGKIGADQWDALDQLADEPDPGDMIYLYKRVGKPANMHLKRDRRAGGNTWVMVANYKYVPEQPDDAIMRDTETWRAWCTEQQKQLEIDNA